MSFSRMHFKDFLLNESKYYLAERVGNILSTIQDLLENIEGIGKRQLIVNCDNIVSQIRSILQDKWSEKEKVYLLDIQKIGVAIAKCMDDKGDLSEILQSASSSFEEISNKLGVPLNSIGNEKEEDTPKEEPKEEPKNDSSQNQQETPQNQPQNDSSQNQQEG